MRRFIKKIKESMIFKILKIPFKIIIWAIEILIIGIAIVIVTQRVTNNEKGFLGFRIFMVVTGSMEPEYAVGDVLITKEKDPSTIKLDDNIVYVGSVGDYKGKIITHNVIKIEQNEEGEYLFHTKGIANTVEDPVVHEDQLYGIAVQNNRVLAFICKILMDKYGLYFFVMIPLILYAFIGFVRAQGERAEQEREERERKRLEQEKRAKRRKLKEAKMQEIEEPEEEAEEIVDEEEEIVEEVKTPKKTKAKEGATKKKTSSEAKNAKSKTKKESANKEKTQTQAKATKTTKKSGELKTEAEGTEKKSTKTAKKVESAGKASETTTKKKKAKEE